MRWFKVRLVKVDFVHVCRFRSPAEDHWRIDKGRVVVGRREDGVEVHVGAPVRHVNDLEPPRAAFASRQCSSKQFNADLVGALRDTHCDNVG